MMRFSKWLWVALTVTVFGLALVFTACGSSPEADSNTPPAVSEGPRSAGVGERSPNAMPDFTLNDLDGNPVRLSDFTGKAVLVNFWATWCPPCKAELPDLVEIQKSYGGEQFTIIGVSLDQTGPASVKKFAESYKLNYPVVMGNQDVVIAYGNFRGIPTSFLLNSRHERVKSYTGMITKEQLAKDLEELAEGSA